MGFSVYDNMYKNAERAKAKVEQLLEKGNLDGAELQLRTISSVAQDFAIVADDLDEFETEWSNRIDDARYEAALKRERKEDG